MHPRTNILTTLLVLLGGFTLVSSAQAQFDSLRRFTGAGEPDKKIAHFEIKGAIIETPIQVPPLFGSEPPTSLKGLLARFKEACHDDSVVAVVVDLQQAALGLAQVEEIHQALRRFAAVDKEVYVHADALTTLTYAASAGASHISLVPTGDLWLLGLYGEAPYLRGMLDMIGVTPDFEQCGDFKTAAETLTQTAPSEEAKRMNQWLYDGLYESLVSLVAEGRGMTPEEVRGLIDDGPYLAEEALAVGLIDSVQHRQDFIAEMKSRYGTSAKVVKNYGKDDLLDIPQDNIWAFFEFLGEMLNPSPAEYSKPTIGVVYVEGVIMTGEAEASPLGSTSGAFSTTIRKGLDRAADEPAVRAVVLRVDSPGGSALASEVILDAAERVGARKPLIVSMGNVAASGGYYVSCGADTIFADRNTITASIGVVGGKLVTTGMWHKLGINWHAEQRGQMAALMSTATPFNDAERAKIRRYMETVYGLFKKHVVEGRGKHLSKPIEEMAGGRVFTGAQALELGLVDRLGGLDDAIKFAARRAGLGEYDIRVIPEPPTLFDMLMGDLADDEFTRQSKAGKTALQDVPYIRATLATLARVDPLRTGAIVRALQGLEVVHHEGVVMMMPQQLLFR